MELPKVDSDKIFMFTLGIILTTLIVTVGLCHRLDNKLEAEKIKNFVKLGYEQVKLPYSGGVIWQKKKCLD